MRAVEANEAVQILDGATQFTGLLFERARSATNHLSPARRGSRALVQMADSGELQRPPSGDRLGRAGGTPAAPPGTQRFYTPIRRERSRARFYIIAKCRQTQDCLISLINSLMARFNSLLGRNTFPVLLRRELGRKPLNYMLDCEATGVLRGLDEQNCLYFPS